MRQIPLFERIDHFEPSHSAIIWFLSGIAMMLFVMLIGLVFMP